MLKRVIGRKLWKKMVRALLLAGIAALLDSVPALGAELSVQDQFVDSVSQALEAGNTGAEIYSPIFSDKQDVYQLMEYACVKVDAPEIFLHNQCYVTYRMVTRGNLSGYCLSAEIDRYEKCNDLDADAIVENLQLQGRTDLEIAIVVHNWLVRSLEYGPSEKSLAMCLEQGRGKCDDYSMIYATVMNAAGVETRCMDGVPNGSVSGHMWNMVCIDNAWYLCDVTNDDIDGNYSHFLKSVTAPNVLNYLGDYLHGYRLCNGVDEFLSYPMAKKSYSVRQVLKCLAKLAKM